MKKRVLLGMSGGVDSSTAAVILKNQGYEVIGITMQMFGSDILPDNFSLSSGADDAAAVCEKLGIQHIVKDVSDEFARNVMKPFCDCYISGGTPNPCINCNKHIKFGLMLDEAERLGCDHIATGHYAEIVRDSEGRWLLKRPFDRKKDQTYVLYNMTQHQLAHTLFPLCGMEKDDIRRIAMENGLITSHKRDSQDICFIPDKDYVSFINRYTGYTPCRGDYLDETGKKIGVHEGYIRYTIGQRKGLGVAMGHPVFVTGKCPENNTVTLSESCLRVKNVFAGDVNLISMDSITEPLCVTAKIRYNAKDTAAMVYPADENGITRVEFEEYADNPTWGQSCVFYKDDIVIGGGIIV